MTMKLHIILIGFMGTGKTTVGTIIAETLSRQMVDTDQYLEEKRGKTIPDIFRDEGEARFRDCEHNVLKELIQSPKPLVITTGGGIVLRKDNVKLMQKSGFVVALTASRNALIERLQHDASRPLLQGDLAQRIDRLMTERRNAYDFAHFKVDTTDKTPDEVAQIIVAQCQQHSGVFKDIFRRQ